MNFVGKPDSDHPFGLAGRWYVAMKDLVDDARARGIKLVTGRVATAEEIAANQARTAELAAAQKLRKAEEKALKIQQQDEEKGRRKANKEKKARHDEAMRYISEYAGTFGLILDLRADRRWGTKWMKLSDKTVDAVLASKERDEQRKQMALNDPDQMKARAFLQTVSHAREGFETAMVEQADRAQPFTPNQLAAIDRWHDRATNLGSVSSSLVDEGMYRTPDGTIWKVQVAVNGSGHKYAKIFHPEDGSFEFVSGAISRLTINDRMSVETAAAWGALYGRCIVCGRKLTDERSIADGIGPICREKV